jgi:antitoxin VapB
MPTETPRLLDIPIAGLYPIEVAQANAFLVKVGHRLGPVNRPFRQEAFGLEVDGHLMAVAVSASMVADHVTTLDLEGAPDERFNRQEVVELARLAAAGPRWSGWPVRALISYSHNAMHRGDLYRFDGWVKVRSDAGSSGGGSWSRPRYATDAVHGSKTEVTR